MKLKMKVLTILGSLALMSLALSVGTASADGMHVESELVTTTGMIFPDSFETVPLPDPNGYGGSDFGIAEAQNDPYAFQEYGNR